jgi:phage host-nuclease inhibitor protein Gam
MKTLNRIKKSRTDAPESLTGADHYVRAIGIAQTKIDEAVAAYEAAVEKLKAELEQTTKPLEKTRNGFLSGLFAFAHAHKKALTIDSKTVLLPSGKFLWRFTPPAVDVENDESMIALLKKRGLTRYIRTVEQLDREALLADRKTLKVAGLRFTQREEFVVVPNDRTAGREIKKTRTIDADE